MAVFRWLRGSSGRWLKAILLAACLLGSGYLLFLTDFTKNLIREINIDAWHNHNHNHDHDDNHNHDHKHNQNDNHNHNDNHKLLADVKKDAETIAKKIQDVRKLIQKKDGKKPEENFPKSSVTMRTSISDHVEGHDIEQTYNGGGYYWGKYPHKGDYIEILFKQPEHLNFISIPSGDEKHGNDCFLDTDLAISTEELNGQCVNYKQVARFVDKRKVEYNFKEGKKMVRCVRLTLERIRTVKNNRQNHGDPYWLIVGGITIR